MPWLGSSIEAEKTIFQRSSVFLLEGGFSDRTLYVQYIVYYTVCMDLVCVGTIREAAC